MIHRRQGSIVLWLVITLAALTACVRFGGRGSPTPTLDPSLFDLSILTGQPCEAPCWYGLRIGVSTKADGIAKAQALSFIDPKEVEEQSFGYFDPMTREAVPASLLNLKCREPRGETCAALVFAGDVLKQIVLVPYPSLSLGQAVSGLGAPEYVGVSHAGGNVELCSVDLIWKERGVLVQVVNDSRNPRSPKEPVRCQDVRGGIVSSGLPVTQVIYESHQDLAYVPFAGADFPWSGFASP